MYVSVLGGMKWLARYLYTVLRTSFFVLVLVLVDGHTRLFTPATPRRYTSVPFCFTPVASTQSALVSSRRRLSVVRRRSSVVRLRCSRLVVLNSHLSSSSSLLLLSCLTRCFFDVIQSGPKVYYPVHQIINYRQRNKYESSMAV